MALTMLPKVFQTILKIFKKIEISDLDAFVTNMNIWVPSIFSHNFVYVSKMVYKWPS